MIFYALAASRLLCDIYYSSLSDNFSIWLNFYINCGLRTYLGLFCTDKAATIMGMISYFIYDAKLSPSSLPSLFKAFSLSPKTKSPYIFWWTYYRLHSDTLKINLVINLMFLYELCPFYSCWEENYTLIHYFSFICSRFSFFITYTNSFKW